MNGPGPELVPAFRGRRPIKGFQEYVINDKEERERSRSKIDSLPNISFAVFVADTNCLSVLTVRSLCKSNFQLASSFCRLFGNTCLVQIIPTSSSTVTASCDSGRLTKREMENLSVTDRDYNVNKKNQLDVTFCILYFSSNSCSTCFGQPCAYHQELTTA